MKLLFLFILMAGASPEKGSLKKLTIGKNHRSLTVEVADDVLSRRKGLMNRTELGADHGMLFVFDKPQKLSFWMSDTYIPLSIGYFDKDKILKEIHHMQPQNMMEKDRETKSYPSKCTCLYALEVNQGWFKRNNIRTGDRFQLKD